MVQVKGICVSSQAAGKAAFLLQKLQWLQILRIFRVLLLTQENENRNRIKGLRVDDKLA